MANLNFNLVILGGHLTADPELKQTQSGRSCTTFTVAENRKTKDGEKVSDFYTVTAWDKTAEFVTKCFHKASSIMLRGRIQNRNWTDKNGQKHYATEIVADEVNIVDSGSEEPTVAAPQNQTERTVAQTEAQIHAVDPLDDLPF